VPSTIADPPPPRSAHPQVNGYPLGQNNWNTVISPHQMLLDPELILGRE